MPWSPHALATATFRAEQHVERSTAQVCSFSFLFQITPPERAFIQLRWLSEVQGVGRLRPHVFKVAPQRTCLHPTQTDRDTLLLTWHMQLEFPTIQEAASTAPHLVSVHSCNAFDPLCLLSQTGGLFSCIESNAVHTPLIISNLSESLWLVETSPFWLSVIHMQPTCTCYHYRMQKDHCADR